MKEKAAYFTLNINHTLLQEKYQNVYYIFFGLRSEFISLHWINISPHVSYYPLVGLNLYFGSISHSTVHPYILPHEQSRKPLLIWMENQLADTDTWPDCIFLFFFCKERLLPRDTNEQSKLKLHTSNENTYIVSICQTKKKKVPSGIFTPVIPWKKRTFYKDELPKDRWEE